jgi:hypothetical protein
MTAIELSFCAVFAWINLYGWHSPYFCPGFPHVAAKSGTALAAIHFKLN